MPWFLITGMLVLFALAIAALSGRDFSFGLVCTVAALIALGCFTSFFGLLSAGVWLARIALVGAAGYCGYSIFVTKRLSLHSLSFSLLAFLGFSAVLWWICRGRLFNDWDEFSHWGLSLKFMFHENTLYSVASSPTTFKSYPPAYTMGQFMIAKTAFLPFREDVLMFAGALISAAFMLYPLRWFSLKKSPLGALGTAVLLFFVPCVMFDHAYYRVSVDMLLGVLIAFFICVLVYEEDKKIRLPLLCAAVFLLTLTKDSGLGLSLLCCIFLAVYTVFAEHSRLRAVDYLPLGISLGAEGIWTTYLDFVGAAERWNFSFSAGTPNDYRKTVLEKFFTQYFTSPDYGSVLRFSVAGWLLVLAVAGIVLFFFLHKSRRKKMLFAFGFAGVAFLAFSAFMLISYLYLFAEIEAVELASFYRYLCTPVFVVVYVVVFISCKSISEVKHPAAQMLVLPLAVLFFFSSSLIPLYLQKIAQAPVVAAQTQHDRYLSQRTARYISALGEASPRLYLITANDAGKMQNMIQYDLYPIRLPEQSTIIACAPKEDEPWVKQYSAQEWENVLAAGYDYVYIYCPEMQFVSDYSALFEDKTQVVVDRMFKVVPTADGGITLRRILVADQKE
jgi:hypothetical protein